MYAVIRTGGKQYKVKAGDTLKVEKLEKSLGEEFDLQDILFIAGESAHVGAPVVANAKVTVVVTQQSKGPKLIIFKRRRRQGYRRLTGHRQPYTEIFVKSIVAPNGEKVTTDKKFAVKDPAKKAARREQEAQEAIQSQDKKAGAKKVARKHKNVAKAAAAKVAPKKKKVVAKKKTAVKKTAAKKKTK